MIYNGDLYPEWKGDVFVTSLKYKTLYKLNLKNNEVLSQDIIFEDLIGRIRDIEVNSIGELFLINSNSNASLWKMSKE